LISPRRERLFVAIVPGAEHGAVGNPDFQEPFRNGP
jgi:hypothetical protein